MKKLRKSLMILSIFSLVLGGCTVPAYLDPDPAPHVKQKIDLSVGLFVDDTQITQFHPQRCLCCLSPLDTWNIETGMGLWIGAKNTFKRVFTNVEILNTVLEFRNKPLSLLITPKIEKFNVSQSLTAELSLHCILVDQEGKVIYENIVSSKGGSQALTGCLLGVYGGQMALSETSNEAFNKAFEFLATDIIDKVDFGPYLRK